MQSRQFSVYILASVTRRLYVGVTSDLTRRIFEHKTGALPGFARRDGITRLVYVEMTDGARDAITREKQIKGWLRCKKVALIEKQNPMWLDLTEEMFQCASGGRACRIQDYSGDLADPSLRSG